MSLNGNKGKQRMRAGNTPLPQQIYVAELGKRFPGIWRAVDAARERGRWPEWCFLPVTVAASVLESTIKDKNVFRLVFHAQRLAALSAWRATQGIYRFDPDLWRELADSAVPERLPVDVFFCLPEWCVYIEVPEQERDTAQVCGFFFHLDWNARDRVPELRFLLDAEQDPINPDSLTAIALPLKSVELAEDIAFLKSSASTRWPDFVRSMSDEEFHTGVRELLARFLPQVIYLCSINADIQPAAGGKKAPARPVPVKTRKGSRLFPPQSPTIWNAGSRIGPVLRAYVAGSETISGPEKPPGKRRKSPFPHVRRAHWHHFWTGPRNEPEKRKLVLRWIHPMLVSFPRSTAAPQAVIRKVR